MSNTGYQPLKTDDPEFDHDQGSAPRRFSRSRRIALSACFVVCAAALSLLYAFPPYFGPDPDTLASSSTSPPSTLFDGEKPLKQCAASGPRPASPPAPINPWASLSVPETTAISEWLNAPDRALNLTLGTTASISDNYIYHIGAWRPAKADALAYLADPKGTSPPDRYARVTIHHGAAASPKVQDYLVGPLPVGKSTGIRELKDVYHREEIPYNARGYTTMGELHPILIDVMPKMAEATQVRMLAIPSVLLRPIACVYRNSSEASLLAFQTTRSWVVRQVR